MMIHINLLPVRQVKKREMGRQLLVLAAVLVVLAGVINFFWYQSRQSEANKGQARIEETERHVHELEKVLSEVNGITKRRNEVKDKLKQLDDRRKSKSGPVRMLDALSVAMPKKVWLETFEEKGEAVMVKGNALSHEDVAEFMRALQNVVWTPKGMGRLVEQKRDGKSSRVELLAFDGDIQDFPTGDVRNFFTSVDLKTAAQSKTDNGKTVGFEITFAAHYAI